MNIQSKIAFVDELLRRGFVQVAPHTLQYIDNRDVITVFIHPHMVIVTSDGVGVIPSWSITQVIESDNGDWAINGWDELLQDVLSRF